MKKILIIIAIIVIAILLWRYCKPEPKCDRSFSGKVVDIRGAGIADAMVELAVNTVKTNDQGEFRICAEPASRYILNVSKLGFGTVSKVYSDTLSKIVITLTKATVVTADPKQEIKVTDMNPEMTVPYSTNPPPPASPLDTIPFVYDDAGHLISFEMPAPLVKAYDAISDFQAPAIGASIVIPANSLVFASDKEKQKRPDGDVQISVNTIDLYSVDGMPGDYTVDLGEGARGGMISYGAANIEAFFNGEALQLSGNKATLTIPVDTLTIISKDSIPEEIPFLVFNKTTGLWDRDGVAKLNSTKTAYMVEVSHFSTFNMDMVFSNQSCAQLCDGITTAGVKELEITVPTKTKRLPLPGSTICSGTATSTECDPLLTANEAANTHAIINLAPNTPVGAKVIVGGTILSTYVFYSGPTPAGSAATYQACNYNSCAGPFKLSDTECWMSGTAMKGPVLAIRRNGNMFDFSWIYIDAGASGTPLQNPAGIHYTVEFFTPPNQSGPLDLSEANWTDVVSVTDQNWKIDRTVTINGVSTTVPVFFRVIFGIGAAGALKGSTIVILDENTLSVGDPLEQDFHSFNCQKVGEPIN